MFSLVKILLMQETRSIFPLSPSPPCSPLGSLGERLFSAPQALEARQGHQRVGAMDEEDDGAAHKQRAADDPHVREQLRTKPNHRAAID